MVEFAEEQRILAAACWQLVGLRDELAEPNSWVRRSIFGVDVFIQNFAGELRGYHNVCAHRGYPLRLEDAGTGVVQCGFHGWVYNRDGVPTGIPRNGELFQLGRDQQHALKLAEVRVDAIGRFVFAAVAPTVPPLVEYLGPYADVFRSVTGELGSLIVRDQTATRANWKRHVEITLDDYHVTTIHSKTLGARAESELWHYDYRRDGRHSSMLTRRDQGWSFDGFWEGIRAGIADTTGYKIFNCFPTCLLVTTRTDCGIVAITPVGPDRSVVTNYLVDWTKNPLTPEARQSLAEFSLRVWPEDREACERWQTTIDQLDHPPVLGRLEDRVAWFRESYAELVAGA